MSIYDDFATGMKDLERCDGFITYGMIFDALHMNDAAELHEPALRYRWYSGDKSKYLDYLKKEREHYKMKYDLYSDVASYILNKLQLAPNDGSVYIMKTVYSELENEAGNAFDICRSLDWLAEEYQNLN